MSTKIAVWDLAALEFACSAIKPGIASVNVYDGFIAVLLDRGGLALIIDAVSYPSQLRSTEILIVDKGYKPDGAGLPGQVLVMCLARLDDNEQLSTQVSAVALPAVIPGESWSGDTLLPP